MLKNLKKSDVESCFAELEIATLLKSTGVDFYFNAPIGQKSSDFDLVVLKNDEKINTEVKCKVETTEVSETGIANKLGKSRRDQLPRGQPGVIFMRVPETWMPAEGSETLVTTAVDKFLRGTTRVVSVVIMTTYFDYSNNLITNLVSCLERVNPRQVFGPGLVPLFRSGAAFPGNRLDFASFFHHSRNPDYFEAERLLRPHDDGGQDGQGG